MAKTADLYACIEPETRDQAERILEALGIPVSNAINMFYKQIILQRGKVKLPAHPVPDMTELTKEQLKSEFEKGFADAAAGRVMPAADVFAELHKENQP